MNEPTTREIIQRLRQRKAELLSSRVQRPAYNKAFTQSGKPGDGTVFIPRRPKKQIHCLTTGKVYDGMVDAALAEGVNSHSLSTAMSKHRIGAGGIGTTGTVAKGNRKEWKWV